MEFFGFLAFCFLLASWLACAIIAGVVAANKGRDTWGFALLGFLFGPAAVVLALVVAKDDATLVYYAVTSGKARICPYCRELIKREAIKCRWCGTDIAERAEPGTTTEAVPS